MDGSALCVSWEATLNTPQSYLIPLLGFASLMISAAIVSNGIQHQNRPEIDPVGRYTVQQTFNDGWLMFDSATGKMCSVPNAQNPNQTISCTKGP